jgi:hypothetical protein
MDGRDFETGRKPERLEGETSLGERTFEQRSSVEKQEVEGFEDHGNVVCAEEKIVLGLAAESLLQIEKGEPAALLVGENLAIENRFA